MAWSFGVPFVLGYNVGQRSIYLVMAVRMGGKMRGFRTISLACWSETAEAIIDTSVSGIWRTVDRLGTDRSWVVLVVVQDNQLGG